jgi:hypothetical protein
MALTRPKYSQIYDTDYKQSVRVATTADVGNLLATGNMTDSVDGVNLTFLDRILVKDQIDPTQNGIYRVLTVGTGSDGTWVRALDADANDKVTSGLTTIISEGDVNAYKTFKLATSDPIIVGTTPLTFVNPFDTGSNVVAGANGQIQYNNFGVPGASPGLSFDALANVLTVGGNVGITTPTPENLKTISAGTTANLPSPGQVGRVYIDTDDDSILYDDGVEWVSVGGGGGGLTASSSPPPDPAPGDFWYDTELNILFQYIDDGDSSQWVDTTSATTVYSGSGGGGSSPTQEYTAQITSFGVATTIDSWGTGQFSGGKYNLITVNNLDYYNIYDFIVIHNQVSADYNLIGNVQIGGSTGNISVAVNNSNVEVLFTSTQPNTNLKFNRTLITTVASPGLTIIPGDLETESYPEIDLEITNYPEIDLN